MISGENVAICKLVNKDGEMIELVQGDTAVHHISVNVSPMEFDILKENESTGTFEKENVCYINDSEGNTLEIVKNRGY